MIDTVRNRRCGGVGLALLAGIVCLHRAETAWAGPPTAEKGVVRMVFVGDIMLDGGPGHYVAHHNDPFRDVAGVLKDADLTVGNLECVIATAGHVKAKSYTFLAKPASIPLLKQYFSALSVANNHSCDWGIEGLASELDLFDKEKVPYFGGGRNLAAARRPLVLTRNDRRVALLGYTGISAVTSSAGAKTAGLAPLNPADVIADIKSARTADKADIVIPYLHWGRELQPMATDDQRSLAHEMIDTGADAVIGSHPHVTQTIEFYRGRPIVYSLGNFVFDYFPEDPPIWTAWMVQLTFGKTTGLELKTFVVELDPAGIPHLLPKPVEAKK